MTAYRTVVVGTDGSDSSLRAVDRAASIAGTDAKLIVASAYLPQHQNGRAADVLKDESYKVSGTAPIYAILQDAKERPQGRREKRRGAIHRRCAGRRTGEPRRGSQCRSARRRQRRSQHDRRAAAGIGARQRLTSSQGRRADRAHHALARHSSSDEHIALHRQLGELLAQILISSRRVSVDQLSAP